MEILKKNINAMIEKLDDRDVEGHIWYNRFLELINEAEEEEFKKELLDEHYYDHPDFLKAENAK